jgi:hypothetical protein
MKKAKHMTEEYKPLPNVLARVVWAFMLFFIAAFSSSEWWLQ